MCPNPGRSTNLPVVTIVAESEAEFEAKCAERQPAEPLQLMQDPKSRRPNKLPFPELLDVAAAIE